MTQHPKPQHSPGWGLCGCLSPYRHEPGCMWGLDRPRPLQRLARAVNGNPLTPRPGCCTVCGYPLDSDAVRQRDDKCSRCYRVLFAANRARVLGGVASE